MKWASLAKSITAWVAIICGCQHAAVANEGNGNLLSLQNRIVELYEQNHDAIVRVKAANQGLTETGQAGVALKFGTGFFISREGHVMTNASVAYKADRVWVVHDGIEYVAEIVGSDLPNKLTILKVVNTPREFSFLHLSDSMQLQPIGSLVVRISAPLEFAPSPFMGMVSGHESEFGQIEFPTTYMRVTIPGGPGEGGAPLLDLNGKFVGMTLGAIEDMPSTSYVLPARAALRLRDDLIFSGQVAYGWVGFDIEAEIGAVTGQKIRVSEILPGTPAEESGLLVGDYLTQIDNKAITSKSDVRDALFATRPEQLITIKGIRGTETFSLDVKIAQRPIDELIRNVQPKQPLPEEEQVVENEQPVIIEPEPDLEENTPEMGTESVKEVTLEVPAEARAGEDYLSEELEQMEIKDDRGMDAPIATEQ